MKTIWITGTVALMTAVLHTAGGQDLMSTGRWSLIGKATSNVCITNVVDRDQRPSAQSISADGHTTAEGTTNTASIGASIGASMEYGISSHWAVSVGTWFTNRNIYLRNTDASYSGVSTYEVLYLQVPLLFKFYTRDLVPKMKLYFHTGPSFDLKVAERLNGWDGAHYWNMAKNRSYEDPFRGINADQRSMSLWAPLDISLYFGAGVQYQLLDNFALCGGLSYNQGFINMFNPSLKFNDAGRTPVASTCYVNSSLVGIDLGVKYTLK